MATINEQGLAMAAGTSPSHVQGVESDQLIFGTQLLQQNPFMLADYYRNHGNYFTTLDKLMPFIGKGATRRVSYSPTTGHWEKPRVKTTITVGGITAGSEANEAVITLSANDMANDNGYVSSLPRVKDEIQFRAGGHIYRIIEKNTNVNPNQITVQADAPDFDPQDEIIVGSVGSIFSNISGEGTDQNKALRPRRYYYENTFQIIKDTEGVTGSNLTTKVKFEPVPDTNLIYMDGLKDMDLRHRSQIGKTWMFGKQPTGWTEESEFMDETATIRGTQGLIEFIRQSGHTMGIDPNDFDINDFYALSAYFSSINRLNYNWVIGVSDRYVADNFKRNWAQTNGRDYNPEGAFINYGFKGFALGQFTYMQTSAPEFSDMQGMGAIGYNDWMVAIPLGQTSVTDNTGLEFQTAYVGYEVRGAEGYVRENELWMRAGAGNDRVIRNRGDLVKTWGIDGVLFYVRTEMAAHFALGDQLALITADGTSS
jgi:hypothetical protein